MKRAASITETKKTTSRLSAGNGQSLRLTNYHVGPTCAPTRAGMLTGHYANSTGVWHTIGGRSLLRRNEWTLAAALADSGYHTGIFGRLRKLLNH